jgi:outer membrane protein
MLTIKAKRPISRRNSMNRINFFILVIAFVAGHAMQAQQSIEVSLKQARAYANEHNYNMRSSALDVEAARYRVKESTASGLPQISGSIGYIDNIALPVQLIPGDFIGQPGEEVELTFGTKYNASASAGINQLIFSGEYIVGLQAAKAFLEKSRKDYVKTQIEVNKSVSEAYFLALAAEESLSVIDSTLSITRKLANQTSLIVAEGFGEETELNQLELLVSELEISRDNALNQISIAKDLLRFHMGIEEQTPLVLTQKMNELIDKTAPESLIEKPFVPDQNIDVQIIKKQQELALLSMRREKSFYLPSVSAFLNVQTQAQRQEWNFFDSNGKWYSNSMFGVTMNIPIFSSGQRFSRVKQAQFQYEQTLIAEDQIRTNLKLQYESTMNELNTAWKTLGNTHQNKFLAERIFRRTGIKYQEGMAGSLDLLNTHNQYLTAQSRYINAALNLLNQQVALESLMEQLP